MKREAISGELGLAVPTFGAVRYADFRFEAVEAPTLRGRVERDRTAPTGSVMKWQVSDPFPEKAIEGSLEISATHKDDVSWTTLESEPTGLANLSRVHPLTREANTVFAKVTVRVRSAFSRRTLIFGYSDRVRLFLNDNLLLHRQQRLQDPRLSLPGNHRFFRCRHLNLKKGTNDCGSRCPRASAAGGSRPLSRTPKASRSWTEPRHFCRPLWGLVSFFVRVPGAHAPG